MYLGEYYSIDSAMLLELIKDKALPLQETLSYIAHMHSEYAGILIASARDTKQDVDNSAY